MNIMNMAMGYIGPIIVKKIASSMGLSNSVVEGLIGAALPSIMGAFTGSSRTAAGAGALFDSIKDMAWGGSDSNVLEQALDGGNIADFTKGGGDLLGGLLGGKTMDGLAGALGRSHGVDQGQAGSLLGMLGPIAMGALKDRVSEDGLDAAGLASFLGDQQSNIASAMPAGLVGELRGTGLMDSFGDAFGSLTGSVGDAASAATGAVAGAASAATGAAGAAVGAAGGLAASAADAAGDAARGAANVAGSAASAAGDAAEATAKKGMGLLPWIIIAAIVAALAWFFLGGSEPEMADIPAADSIMAGDVNLSETFSTGLEGFTGALGSVKDAASAEAALPAIEGFGAQLEDISGMAGDLPDAAKGVFGSVIATALETVKPMIESAIGIDGVGDILGPVLSGIVEKLTALAG